METENLILLTQFCVSHEIEISFVESLQDYGLVEITVVNQQHYLAAEKLSAVEKMIRLHYDLQVNLEGLHVISELLDKIEHLQTERISLQNKIDFYGDEIFD